MICWPNDKNRKFPRIKVSFSILYRIEGPVQVRSIFKGKEFEAKTIDLSELGVSMLVSHDLPLNTRLVINFKVEELTRNGAINVQDIIEMSGDVTSIIPLENGQYRIGVSFGRLDEEKEGKFFDLICSPLSYPH